MPDHVRHDGVWLFSRRVNNDRSPYAKWFNRLNAPAAARVVTALVRIEQGNFSNVKGIGGGTKKRQNKDIEVAKALWKEYKNRKRREL